VIFISDIQIEEEITKAHFACDVQKCKGACCTIAGSRGAPLEDAEIPALELASEAAMKYLPADRREILETYGAFEGAPGSFATTCVDDRDCVFVYYDGDVARCSLERAFLNGETNWRKPISCHLFPIRVGTSRGVRLRYEKISECKPAIERGKKENIFLHDFLKDSLARKFGPEWYEKFDTECRNRNAAESIP
jgi:hypothetical protein